MARASRGWPGTPARGRPKSFTAESCAR